MGIDDHSEKVDQARRRSVAQTFVRAKDLENQRLDVLLAGVRPCARVIDAHRENPARFISLVQTFPRAAKRLRDRHPLEEGHLGKRNLLVLAVAADEGQAQPQKCTLHQPETPGTFFFLSDGAH
jgi:hypothetical protein